MNAAALYAANTEVSVERSKLELERVLRKAGASQYGTTTDDHAGKASVYFRLGGRAIRLAVPLPRRAEFVKDARRTWKTLPVAEQERRWEQACRTRWRGLVLICKAKLQLITLELSTVEREFLADVLLPDGRSVSDIFRPVLDEAYRTGKMPQLGPARSSDDDTDPTPYTIGEG